MDRDRVPGTGRTVVVRNYDDLRGLRVAAVGSAQLMGQMIERQLGLNLALRQCR